MKMICRRGTRRTEDSKKVDIFKTLKFVLATKLSCILGEYLNEYINKSSSCMIFFLVNLQANRAEGDLYPFGIIYAMRQP